MSQQEKTSVPVLRFPGFDGDWGEKKLGELFPKIRNGFVGTATPYYEKGGVAYLQGKNVKSGKINPDGLIGIAQSFHEKQKKSQLRKNDILMVQSGHVGECAVVSTEYENANCHALIVMTPTNRVDPDFIKALFYAPPGLRKIYEIKTGNTVEHVLTSDLKPLPVCVPLFSEQQKIANFLSSVDQKISQLTEKKALLEDYKKGCMQKLFSQELRFKNDGGNDFPDWNPKVFGDVFSWVKTNSLSRDMLTDNGGEVQNIHYGDIHTKFHANFYQSNETVPYIKGGLIGDFSTDEFCRVGDVVIADASEDYADIGKAIEIVELNKTPLVAGLHTYIARSHAKLLARGFAGYLLRSVNMRQQIMRIAQGISVLGISKGNLEKIKMELPHPDEQQKIADFLSSIDQKIDQTSQELEQAKLFKKGLLQQMFV